LLMDLPAHALAAVDVLYQIGVASEFGKNRTVSRWHGLTSRK
jgi:hypothetical protein